MPPPREVAEPIARINQPKREGRQPWQRLEPRLHPLPLRDESLGFTELVLLARERLPP